MVFAEWSEFGGAERLRLFPTNDYIFVIHISPKLWIIVRQYINVDLIKKGYSGYNLKRNNNLYNLIVLFDL